MNLDGWLALCGGLGLVALLASGAIRHLPVTAPVLALGAGLLLGPPGLGLLQVEEGASLLHGGSEVLLAISLVAVALRYPVGDLRDVVVPTAVLVTVGLLVTAAIGALLAWWLLGLAPAAAALLGVVLAPTDPVLASSVVTGEPAEEGLPGRLRRTLSTESGANDGLGWPLAVVAVAVVLGHDVGAAVGTVVLGVVAALVVGVAIGWVVGTLVRRLDEDHDLEAAALFVAMLALAGVVLGVVNLLGADGILAVLAAGLAYNRAAGDAIVREEREVEEGVNRMLVLPLFVLVGAMAPVELWRDGGPALAGFVVAVLLLRRLPVLVVLGRPLGFGRLDAAFLGWFGPMGVASVFYVSMARAEGVDSPTVWAAALAVVAASTLVHGTTAAPFRRLHERLDRDHGAAGPEAATAERRCAAPGPPAGTGMGGGE